MSQFTQERPEHLRLVSELAAEGRALSRRLGQLLSAPPPERLQRHWKTVARRAPPPPAAPSEPAEEEEACEEVPVEV